MLSCWRWNEIRSVEVGAVDADAASYIDTDRLVLAFLSTKTPSTQKSYGLSLTKFRAWCDERRINLLEVKPVDLTRYFAELEKLGRAPTTIGAVQGALASFFDFMIVQGLSTSSPMADIKRPPRVREPDTLPLGRDELVAVVAATESMPDLDSSVVLLIAFNGFKPNEILGLQASGLQQAGVFWALAVPGRKADELAILPPVVAERILRLLGDRRVGPLFPEIQDRFQITRMVERAGKRARLQVKLNPNVLRVTMMSVALGSGSRPGTLSKALALQDPRAFAHLMPIDDDPAQHPALRVANAVANVPVTEDLLQQVGGLLTDASIHPVAPIVLLGAILESKLRSMLQQNGLVLAGTPGLSRYVDALRTAKSITQLEWRELQYCADLRNQAAHGRDLDELTTGMAKKMAQGVADFLKNH